jgi:hypothetical protein
MRSRSKVAKVPPAQAPSDKTQFRVRLDFVLEVDGAEQMPDWLAEQYKLFIVCALIGLKLNVPIRLLAGSKISSSIANVRQLSFRRAIVFAGGVWNDKGCTDVVQVHDGKVQILDHEGKPKVSDQ